MESKFVYFIINDLSNPDFIHLRHAYFEIIKEEKVRLVSIENKIDTKDLELLNIVGINNKVRNIEDIVQDNHEVSIIFPNASIIPEDNKILINSKSGCFIGGLDSKRKIKTQINITIKNKIDFLFSDLLPTEVSKFINYDQLKFFCERFTFVKPFFKEYLKINSSEEESILFVSQYEPSSSVGKFNIIYNILDKLDQYRVVNLDIIESSKWLDEATPSSNCTKVVTDSIDPIFFNYLFELCGKNEIDLITLWSNNKVSLARYFIYDNNNSSDWFSHDLNLSSIRKFLMSFLSKTKTDSLSHNIPPYDNSFYDYKSVILSNYFCDSNTLPNSLDQNFIKRINSNFSFKDQLISINYNNVTVKDYNWKLTQDSINQLESIIDLSHIPNFIINKLYYDSIKKVFSHNINQYGYIFLYKLFNISDQAFLKSIDRLISDKFSHTCPFHILASVQYVIQTFVSTKETRGTALHYLSNMIELFLSGQNNVSNELLYRVYTRILLSLENYSKFEEIYQYCVQSSYRGIVGDSVYFKIIEGFSLPENDLEYFEQLCLKEVELELDNNVTHLSLSIISVLKFDSGDQLESIINSKSKISNFSNVTWFMFQLCLICIITNQKNRTESILSKLSLSKAKKSCFNYIGITALKILNGNDIDSNFDHPVNNIDDGYTFSILENEKLIHPYFIYFFLEVIFRATNNEIGIEFTSYHRSRLPKSNVSSLDDLLNSVIPLGNNNDFLKKLSEKLSINLPEKDISLIRLSNLQ